MPVMTTNSQTHHQDQDQHGSFAVSQDTDGQTQVKMLVETYLQLFAQIWRSSIQAVAKQIDNFGLNPLLDEISRLFAKHPLLTICMITTCVCVALPVLTFFALAILTVILAFMGFVLIEGTLIAIASVLLFAFLGSCAVGLMFCGVVALGSYCGLLHVFDNWATPTNRRVVGQFQMRHPHLVSS